jgi:ribosomal protein S18 acetylase RimI-like enzyme
MNHRIAQVPTEAVYPLRLLVLRPGGRLRDCVFAGDDEALHFAAFTANDEVVGVASFFDKGHPDLSGVHLIQLRGMATDPNFRGEGFGKALVEFALGYFAGKGTDMMWCNARQRAVGFYESLGFVKIGAPFNIEGIGEHWMMYRALPG